MFGKGNFIKDKILQRSRIFDDPTSIYRRVGFYLYQGFVPGEVFESNKDTVPEFSHLQEYHEKTVYDKNGNTIGKRKVDTLNMPKVATSFLRRMILSEGAELSIDNDPDGKKLKFFQDIIDRNQFYENEGDNIEEMLNGGDKLLMVGRRNGNIKISYLNGFKFEIIEYDQGVPQSIVVYNDRKVENQGKFNYVTLLEYHKFESKEKSEDGQPHYRIYREIYLSKDRYRLEKGVNFNTYVHYFGVLKEKEDFKGVEQPMFVFTRLPYKNNKQLNTIRGLGMFINSLDVNRNIDRAYDANNREIEMTKFQILVPDEMLEHAYDKDGNLISYYNSDKTYYSGLNTGGGQQDFQPLPVSPHIRQESYTAKIKQDLNILSMQLGMSAGTFDFDYKMGRVTATQVIAEMNETHRTKIEIGDAITRGWRQFLWSIYQYAKHYWKVADFDMEFEDINWELNDSVIVDDEAVFKRDLEAVREGIMPHREFLMKHYDLSDTEADDWLSQVNTFDFEDLEDEELGT